MLNYPIFAGLSNHLLEITKLSKFLNQGAGVYTSNLLEFLRALQSFADEHKLFISSDIALAIQNITTFNGNAKPIKETTIVKRNLRKERDVYSVRRLEELHAAIKEFLSQPRNTYEECSNIWRQITARLMNSADNGIYTAGADRAYYIIGACKSGELSPYYVHIIGLIGIYNARALLDAVLPSLGL